MMTRWILSSLFFLLCASVHADLNPVIQHKNELKDLNSKINTLQQSIDNASDKHETLMEELAKTETQIGTLNVSLDKIIGKLDKLPNEITALHKKIASNESFLQEQQKTLAKQIRAAYIAGQHDVLKLLLQEESPERISRLMEYYRAIGDARSQLIKNIDEKNKTLTVDRQKAKQEKSHLEKLRTTQQDQQQKLQQSKQYREAVLKEINAELAQHKNELTQLNQNKRSLEKVLTRLKKRTRESGETPKPFDTLLHRLPLPTQGNIAKTFGEPILQSNLVYNGIFIQAPEGRPVRSIYSGNVVFADWLRGFGLLIIVDHGDGYMSLYAHNESLFKHAGESVQADEVIAKVGHTGGHPQPGLYFEIRHNGIPADPKKWFKSLV